MTTTDNIGLENRVSRTTFDNLPRQITRPRTGEIAALNALKFICAIMIIGIHIPFVGQDVLLTVYRVAVPIFFMISGYFMPDSEGVIRPARLVKTMKKILIITVAVNLIYYIYKAAIFKFYTYPPLQTLIVGGTIGGAFWYLNAYLQVLAVIWLAVKFKATRILPWTIPLGLIANLIFGSYFSLFFDSQPRITFDAGCDPDLFFLHRNFFTIGLPCVVIGLWIRLRERRMSALRLSGICALLIIAVYIETYLLCGHLSMAAITGGDIVALTIPLAVCIFLCALNIRYDSAILTGLAKLGRDHSLNIYLYHYLAHAVILLILVRIPFIRPYQIYWDLPLTFVAVMIFSVAYVKIMECNKAKRKSRQQAVMK